MNDREYPSLTAPSGMQRARQRFPEVISLAGYAADHQRWWSNVTRLPVLVAQLGSWRWRS
jgi:hypothetical protein